MRTYWWASFLTLGVSGVFAAPLPTDLKLTITASGATQTLNLHKRTARTSDFTARTWDSSNGYQVVSPTPEVRTFRGTVTENPNALVIASIDANNNLTAYCFDREYSHNAKWSVTVNVASQLVTPLTPSAMPSQTVAAPRGGSTGTPKVGPTVPTGTSAGGVPYGGMVEYELAGDLFVAAYTRAGQNVDSAIAAFEVNAMIHEQMMARDELVRVVIPSVVVRKENFYPADPGYPGAGDLGSLLAEWRKEPLYSTRWDAVWGSEGRVASSGQIGKDESSVSVGALYHENTHNWGAFHLAYQCDTMGGNQPSIGPMTVDAVRAKRKIAIDQGKLPAAPAYTDPLHPFTHVDVARTTVGAAIDIDVLANDMDANGDTLTVSSFTTSTVPGGTVTLNPNGTLHYVPPAGYAGKDVIVYTAQDNSTMGLKTCEVVHIEVTGTGLTARYKFDETSGTIAAADSNAPSASLNGNNFSTASVTSPLGKGVRAWGYQNDDQVENGQWSGIVLGNGNVMPVPLYSSSFGRVTPFEQEYNQNSGCYDIMDGNYTFSTWFRCDDYTTGGYVASKWWHPETRVGWDMQIANKQLTLHWRIFQGAQGIQTLVAPAYSFADGGWYHLAAAFDRATGEIRLYINGTKVATRTSAFASNGVIFNGRAPLCLGAFSNGSHVYDDTRIYAKALADSEVQTLFAEAGLGTPRLLDSSASIAAIAGNPVKKSIVASVWNGGDNVTYSIVSGPAWLKVNANGELTGTPEYWDAASSSAVVRVTDSTGDSVDLPVNLTVKKTGAIARYYSGASGTVSSLTSLSSYPYSPYQTISLGALQIPANAGDSYGVDARAWLVPTVSGNYTFWIASDDSSELWLSTDENPSGAVKIASLSGWTGVNNWTAYASQQSVTIPLVAGHRYFLKVLYAEGSGGDHMEVAWAGPGISQQVIPEANLIPYRADVPLAASWKMDDGSGTTVADSSGNGANGTLVGSTTWTTAGKVGGALQLNGGSVNIGKPEIGGAWTASMWVKRQGTGTTTVMMEGSSSSLRLEQYYNTKKVGVTRFGVADWASNYATPLDTWVHLTFVCNKADTRLYVNGALQYTFPQAVSCPMTSLCNGMVGVIDEMRVYGKACDAAEVLSLYQGATAVAPVAQADSITGPEEAALIVADPLFNDSDANGDALSIQSFSQGAHGSVTQSGSYLHYTPAANWSGPDSFTYVVSDGNGGTATGTVTVNVTPTNDAPVFVADPLSKTATEDASYTASLAGDVADPDAGDTLTFSKVSGPAWLSVAANGALSGTPTNGNVGTNSFVVRVTDAAGAFDEAVLNVTVNNTNDVPTFGALTNANATEDSAFSGNVASAAADVDAGDTLTFSKASGPAWLNVASNGAISGTPLNGNVGANNFVLRVTDAAGAFAESSLTITVANVNDAPTFGTLANANVNEDAAFSVSVASAANDVDAGDTLTFSKVSGPAWVSVASNGIVSGTPLNGDVGASSLVIRVTDAAGASADSSLSITVANVNDAPVFTADPISKPGVSVGSAYTGQTLAGSATDVDAGDTMTYSKVSGPAWLSVAADGTLSGTPTLGDAGANSFTVRVTDASGASDDAALQITIANTLLAHWTFDEATGSTAADSSVNGNTATVTGATWSTPRVGVSALSFNGTASQYATAASLNPSAGFTICAWIKPASVSQGDRVIVSEQGSFGFKISNGNLRFTTPSIKDHDATAGLTANTWAHVVITFQPGATGGAKFYKNGVLLGSVNASSISNTANPTRIGGSLNWTGQDFNGSIDDVRMYSSVLSAGEITNLYNAYPALIAPVFTNDPIAGAVAAEDASYSGTLAGAATDANSGDTLTFSKVSGPAWLNVATNGALSGTPLNGDVGANSFTVRVTDLTGLSDDAVLNVTVNNTNDAPTFSTLANANANEDVAFSSSVAGAANDVDLGDTLTFSKVSGPAWLNVAANGALSGTPSTDDIGANVYTLRVTDVAGSYAETSLSITVSANSLTLDSDGDGYSDGFETAQGSDPGNATNVPASLLKALWKFDNAAASGSSRDEVGGVIGNLLSGAVFTADGQGRSGQAGDRALDLGTTSAGQRVEVTVMNFLQQAAQDDKLTISFWQKLASTGVARSAFWAISPTGGDGQRGIQAHTPWSNGTVYFDCGNSAAANRVSGTPSGVMWTNWNHIALVKNGGTMSIWVNGSLLVSGTGKQALLTNFTKLYLGCDGGATNCLRGKLDDFAVFDSALTNAQIVSLASGAAPEGIQDQLPLPWTNATVGTGALAGSSQSANGNYTISGSGVLGGAADQAHYIYQTLTGDGEIVAKISSLQNTGTSASVGVMVRDSLASNAANVFVGTDGAGTYRWSRRTTAGGSTTTTNGSAGTPGSQWVKLVRSGDTFAVSTSADGSSWTTLGSTSVTMASNCYIGLSVSSGSATTISTSQFSNVSVTP